VVRSSNWEEQTFQSEHALVIEWTEQNTHSER